MRTVIASVLTVLVDAAITLAQSIAPVPLARIVASTPTTTKIVLDKRHQADLLRWQVTDPLAPYSGTTLVWLDVEEDDVRLSIDAEPIFADITRNGSSDDSLVAVISGGMWRGAYDTPWQQRKPDGLVVASGVPKGDLKPTNTGGVAVICGADVSILAIADFPKQTAQKKVVIPCNKKNPSLLQSNVILVRDGKIDPVADDSPANRLAFCSGHDHVVIAGAFNSFGHALTLGQFAEFIAAAAARRPIKHLTALNLDGACAAQLFIPQLRVHYGCDGLNYMVNRILVRRAR